MTDLKQMIDSVGLTECQKEIERQMSSISTHGNRMKRVVLLCLLGKSIHGELAKEDPDKFIDELSAFLDKIANENTENGKRLMAHVKENGEILKHIDAIPGKLQEIKAKADDLMEEYDRCLADVIKTRDNLPICKL